MERALLSKILFGENTGQILEQYNELISGLEHLKLKCPKVFPTIEHAIEASYYHDKYCLPFFKEQVPLSYEEHKKDKEEIVYLRGEVINLEEEIVKLKVAKRKTTAKSKKSKSKR